MGGRRHGVGERAGASGKKGTGDDWELVVIKSGVVARDGAVDFDSMGARWRCGGAALQRQLGLGLAAVWYGMSCERWPVKNKRYHIFATVSEKCSLRVRTAQQDVGICNQLRSNRLLCIPLARPTNGQQSLASNCVYFSNCLLYVPRCAYLPCRNRRCLLYTSSTAFSNVLYIPVRRNPVQPSNERINCSTGNAPICTIVPSTIFRKIPDMLSIPSHLSTSRHSVIMTEFISFQLLINPPLFLSLVQTYAVQPCPTQTAKLNAFFRSSDRSVIILKLNPILSSFH